MPGTDLKYTSENVETGSVFDILVGNLLAYRAEEWGWSEQDYTKISEEFADAASNDLYYLPAGNYKVSNFPVSLLPTELNIQSTEFVNLQVITDSTSAKTYWLNILNKTYYASIPNAGLSSITWNDASEIGKGADVTTIHVSNTAPTISDNGSHIWIDTSNVNTNGYASMKQWDSTTSTWKGFVIPGMMDKSVYDTAGKNTDPFIYVMDKLEEVAGDYAQFIRHKNNELTLIHVTSEEKDIYNNDLLTLDQISQMFGTGGSIYEEMVNFIENETAEQFGTEDFSAQLTAIEDALNEHITNHIDDTKITSWDNKANLDHTHNLDNRVTITGNDIEGILTTEQGNMPSSQWWNSVCYGNGKYVAVSDTNIMAYSTDGINWTQGTMPISEDWQSVCYGNGKYVAVSNSNTMAYSTDGINWTEGTMPWQDWSSVCYGNGKFVAVGNTNIMAYSTDGISWNEGTMPWKGWNSVCYGNGKYVAVAESTNIMAYSTDGISWTQGTMPSSQRWQSVCYGNGKFVAVAESTNIMAYSTDGINWNEGNMPSKQAWQSVCYGNSKYVALTWVSGSTITNIMAYSTNGISWTQGTLPSKQNWSSVCYGNSKYVAVANVNSTKSAVITFRGFPLSQVSTEAKERIYQLTSLDELENPISETDLADKYHNGNTLYIENADGSTEWWKIIDNTKLGKEASVNGQEGTMPSSQAWSSVCYGNDKFVAVITNGSNIMAYSTDGISWTQGNMPSSKAWTSVCYGNGKFVAVASSSTSNIMAYSTDGISWTQGTMPSNGYWNSVCYGNDKYVAVGSNTNIMAYSTDGISWSKGSMPSSRLWQSVCYGNGKYVVIGNTSDMAYSTDGISWTEGNMPSNQYWYSVCYGNGKYVAIPWGSNDMAYSTDGISWTEGNMPSNQYWYSVCYGNGKFVAVVYNSNIMAYSTDGINWTQGNMPSSETWKSVCYGNGKFVAVAINTNLSYAFTISDFRDGLRLFSTTLSSMDFSNILNKPDTLSGYGITDGVLSSDLDEYRTKIEALQNLEFVPEGYDVASVGSNDLYLAVQKRVNTNTEMSIDSSLFDIVLNDPGQETVSKFAMLNDEKRSGIKNFGLKGNMPYNKQWRSVCYGNDKFVAVATNASGIGNDKYAYSTDGISWTEGTMPSSRYWYSVCYGNDKFVAMSSSIMAYSTNGINWTEGNMPSSQNWYSVCYGNDKFVAIGEGSNIMAYSTDGISWTEGNMPSSQPWYSVCYGNGKYVAITMIINESYNIMAYSTDGISWTQGTLPGSQDWISVCHGNDKFVAVGGGNDSTNIYAYSTDGISWTQGTMPSRQRWYLVCYGNGKYVAITVGDIRYSITAYSTDGINWVEGTTPGTSIIWESMCYGNGKYVAIAGGTNIMLILYLPTQIGDTYINTKEEFVPFSKFPSFDTTSKYFTTEYSTDSVNPNWSSQGIGRVIKIDKTQNNTVLDNVTIATYSFLNVILNVKWDTTKGLVFSFSINSAVTSLNSIYNGLNTSADSVNAYLEDALTLVNSLVS